jgi:ferrochelatase
VTTGVVLMTYGAPKDDADLPRYLAAVRGGRTPTDDLVAEMRRRYALIGGSPLVRITREQAQALQRKLGDGYAVAAGMRFSDPSIAEAAREVVRRGAERIVGVVLSPQWSPILMGGYLRALADAAGPVSWATSEGWHREPLFIEALSERLTEALADADPQTAVLLTAHSLPRRVFDTEPAYVAQLRETAELVAARAGLVNGAWRWAYQSAGHTAEEWLRPDLKELFPALAAEGRREVLVAPVQFLADHLEVLYDLDIAAADDARASGLRYRRVAMPNTSATFIRALASVARATESRISVAV